MKAMVVAIVSAICGAMLVLAFPNVASGQSFPCPGGPGPGEVGIGVPPGEVQNMCVEAADDGGGGTVTVDTYGSHAVDPDYKRMFWSLGHDSQAEARGAAMQKCKRTTGKECASLGTFWNQCLSYALDEGGDGVFAGPASSPEKSARAAMNKCAADGNGSACRMLAMPVCAGIQYSGAANGRAARATPAEVEAYAASYDKREYWGALATNESGVRRSFKYRTKAEAERGARSDCKGCTMVVSHANSCAALAWPAGQKNVNINAFAVDADPARARDQALQECQKKFGQCKVVWTSCSRRGSTDPFGDWK